MGAPLSPATTWLAGRGWTPFDFQRAVWDAIAGGQSGLLHATTGAGKTYAVWLGMLDALLRAHPPGREAQPLRVVWLTPMRALASDTAKALAEPLRDLAPMWTLGLRTGDTASAERTRQDRRFPTVLVTTPESLTLMLTREKASEELATVAHVVVDEWHELIGSKRGVQVQLALARLRRLQPGLVTWGLSATLGNLEQAAQVLCGPQAGAPAALVRGRVDKTLVIDTLVPPDPGKYSWAGHLGARMQLPVVQEIEKSGTTLVFTNVRSQAEIWYQLLLQARPDWAGEVALHHGSMDKAAREWVEEGLKAGRLRAVVATSSLDLGVDFLPVERVLQIGSAKGVARMMQRAGRSGHAPGRVSRITLVPTHTLELVEAAAARRAAQEGRIESRESPRKPLDVLVQHIVTVALGGGFRDEALFEEVRTAWAFRDLTREEFDWALAFCERGGQSLNAYPDYHRIARDEAGVWRVPDRGIAKRHRLGIGTIVSDASMQVKYLSGGSIGTIEEGFIARLRKGDCFFFAGRLLEFVRVQDMAAYVKKAAGKKGTVPTWQGSKMALSTELGDAVLEMMQAAARGEFEGPELQAARPMLEMQARLSRLPTPATLLVESLRSREGQHLYVHPFAGRHVHLGLASLLAWRLARERPGTFSLSVNDYGFELVSAEPFDLEPVTSRAVFATGDLLHDVLASLNSSELAQRRFREIARIAGLVFSGYPGQPKSMKQLQASSGLFFEVFRKYDRGNLLLTQAETEVLSQELEISRLAATLERVRGRTLEFVELRHPSPMSLPLMVERFREKLTTEQLSTRLDRILRDAERAGG
ncbi:ligase-associated DNA damage response DEXH box helicase [Ramlibacter tataouinensis]|uniref:Candidate large helicase-related protein n=1 Tax=Ramlibacter tataouinensis (strain ATCC BAA-407 / DSM 14655 / LMG 21543 / TTB310) TaxID=365046 RepID=F5XWQ8_RAMTT|nr:ligase-associated DNA damage response DEXH box helicase [Ramlibacter tataouinensis]AEG94202.1 Candidate large helicase-related protein [Ramlibacter tataouinensis TTB310]